MTKIFDDAKITVAIEPPRQDRVMAMLRASDAYYATLYPEESNHLLDLDSLEAENTTFYVARLDGDIAGFGALVELDGYAEIKRMYVSPEQRGYGLGRRLLAALEARALHRASPLIRLETGVRQPEAIALYHAFGYAECPPFGAYDADPLSLFMEKRLGEPPNSAS